MPAPPNLFQLATAPAAGSHLPVALLRQYADGTLPPAAQHRVEAHTLACPRCADVLDGLLQTDAATTDAALARLRQRLRWRVLQQPARRLAARPRWVMAQLTAAAVLLLGLVAGGWWTWQRHSRSQPALATAAAPPPAQPAETQAPAAAPPAPSAQPAAAAGAGAPVAAARPARPTPKSSVAARPRRPEASASPTVASTVSAAAVSAAESSPTAAAAGYAAAASAADTAASTEKFSGRLAADAPADAAKRAAPAAPSDGAAYTAKAARAKAVAGRADETDEARRAGAMPRAPSLLPAPLGGQLALREYLRRGANAFEPEINASHVSGTVHVQLTIGANGKIEKVKVTRGLRPDYDAEALRLVCEGPGWAPGVQNGQRTAQTVDVTVPF